MFLTIASWTALAVLLLGLAYKIKVWLTIGIGPEARGLTPGQRGRAVLAGLGKLLFSARIVPGLAGLVLDGIVQRRVWAHSRLAWLTHQLIWTGFTGLILLHALGGVIGGWLPDYYATLNPYLFLRNLFGAMVVVGVALAIYRRAKVPGMKVTARAIDRVAIALIAVILLSGFGLEALKITSHRSFDRMVEEFAGLPDAQDLAGLRQVWARDYGVVFPAGADLGDAAALEKGRALNEDTCLSCHHPPQWGFLSWGLAQAIRPVAVALADAGGEKFLWYLHVVASLVGLALLPFTKFLHLITTPLLYLVRAAIPRAQLSPANLATLRVLELDACMHCATCSVHCSVAAALRETGNLSLMPSEKLAWLGRLSGAKGPAPTRRELARVRQGAYICTSCLRCTNLCPAGINLQDLWLAMKEDLAAQGLGPTQAAVRQAQWEKAAPSRSQVMVRLDDQSFQNEIKQYYLADSFRQCFKCMTCTNGCPVVHMYDKPQEHLDLLPHQIMHAIALGLKDEALGARMTWNCLTCYLCQEACPQGVRVADILYHLRHLGGQAAPDLEG
ncbi:MAG: 4Fe-4S dicluster domain-containing protein [Desulfarculus sp.]|nr:4Fe-4S dicluster domain-containing protein [Desulfarculus sp.]